MHLNQKKIILFSCSDCLLFLFVYALARLKRLLQECCTRLALMVSLQKSNRQIYKSNYSILWFPYVKIAEKGTLFIFGQKTEKVVSNQATLASFFTSLAEILFLYPFISLDLTKYFRGLEDQMKHTDRILLKIYHFQKKLLVEAIILVL